MGRWKRKRIKHRLRTRRRTATMSKAQNEIRQLVRATVSKTNGEGGIRYDFRNTQLRNELSDPREPSAAAGAALHGKTGPIDPGFALVQNVWPVLPKITRRRILALIRKAAKWEARPLSNPASEG